MKVTLAVTSKGQTVTILRTDEDMVKVSYPNGRQGWISATEIVAYI